jgi:diacylglycerol kinase family enzyme
VTIRKGEPWGEAGALPEGAVVVHSDAEARAIVETARRAGDAPPPLGLLGGDLCRTLGGRGDAARLESDAAMRLPVDLGAVLVDGRLHWFVAHLVARGSWWRGRIVAAMNAEFLGPWDVAPRSHPGDALLDTFDVTMAVGDRAKAWRRLPSGTHVPHPAIRERRVAALQVDLDSPTALWLDGERVARNVRSLSIRLEPDALVCIV